MKRTSLSHWLWGLLVLCLVLNVVTAAKKDKKKAKKPKLGGGLLKKLKALENLAKNTQKNLQSFQKDVESQFKSLAEDIKKLKASVCDCDSIAKDLKALKAKDKELESLIKDLLDDPCKGKPCLNGGSCKKDGAHSFTCKCLAGYTGDRCEINIDDCKKSSCKNGGICIDLVNAFHCVCQHGFYGENCEIVDGRWTDWEDSGPCNVKCGHGIKLQSRQCTPPQNGGKDCQGPKTRKVPCFEKDCPVNGRWTDWEDSGPCNALCGQGSKPQVRHCIPAQHGGKPCTGPKTRNVLCYLKPCPEDGRWTDWEDTGPCSVKCGHGTKPQGRSCIPPKHGGKECPGPDKRKVPCFDKHCPVDGKWSTWYDTGICNVKCGSGTKPQSRHCVPPQHGGKDCQGPSTRDVPCFVKDCPVDGKWGPWKDSGPCNVKCGHGTKPQSRTCTPPKHGGKPCEGPKTRSVACFLKHCPVDGKWTPWKDSGPCNVKCGHGTKPQSRTCIPPLYGGKNCEGPSSRKVPCFTRHCPINGGWTPWSKWSPCKGPCFKRQRTRTRSCTNPKPQHGGKNCVGISVQSQRCPFMLKDCIKVPVDPKDKLER